MNYNKILPYISLINTKNIKLIEFYEKIVTLNNIHFIPSVSYEIAFFLRSISKIKQPKNILEIGFGSGVSSLFIRNGFKNYKKFITLELDKKRYDRGVKLLLDLEIDNIELINTDAFEYFKKNKLKFDYVFLDAVKRDYVKYIDQIKSILNSGGIFVTDNILFGGRVVEESVEKKYENGVKSVKMFNELLSEDKSFETIFLPIDDGISLSIKH